MAYNQARTSCGFWGESFHNCSDPVVQYDRSLFWCWWGGRKRVSFPIFYTVPVVIPSRTTTVCPANPDQVHSSRTRHAAGDFLPAGSRRSTVRM